MHNFLSLFRSILRPWFCVVVYLWALELQRAYRPGPEPLLDQFADASSILWTSLFWTLLFCAALTCAGSLWPRSAVTRANDFLCRACCLIVTGFFLRHWIGGWRPPEPESAPVTWVLFLVVASLYWFVRRRRKRAPAATNLRIPSWRECFSFAVLPVLLTTVVILGIKIADRAFAQRPAEAASGARLSEGKKSKSSAPNVIVIVADAMRAQSMSLYGYNGQTTPFLARFGEMSEVYLDMHSNSTTTSLSLSTLLSGKHPLTRGRLSPMFSPHYDQENLLHVLRKNGYRTAAVTSNVDAGFRSLGLTEDLTEKEQAAFSFLTLPWLRDLGIYPTLLGEQMYADLSVIWPVLGFPQRTSHYGDSEDTLDLAKQMVARLREPYFLMIHFHQPHDPYTPLSFRTRVRRFLVQFGAGSQVEVQPYSRYASASQPIVDTYKVQYEASIQRVDTALEEFIRWLDAKSGLSNLLLIVTGDHGESFERGYMNHGEELYENSTHVPLLVRFPGQQIGQRVSGLVQSVDIAPTILRSLNISVPSWMEGQPLLPGSTPAGRPVVAMNYYKNDDGVYPFPTKLAIWWDRYKMIVSCAPGTTELYDLSRDGKEQMNLATQETDRVEDLKRKLRFQLARQSGAPKLTCASLGS
jgi:arylsulfatase A-like enzyme